MATGRCCGTCTLCCKLLSVSEIVKPALTMCKFCTVGRGCGTYQTRPTQCRLFNCHFLENPRLSEEWRPSKSHIVLVVSPDGRRIGAQVDPDRPGAWRRKQFYAQLKSWARMAVSQPGHIGQVLVNVGKQAFVILPDRDVDIGVVGPDEIVITEARPEPTGVTLNAFKLHKDDPRAAPVLRAATPSQQAIF